MKKIIAIALAVMLFAALLSVGVAAEGTYGANEQKLIEYLSAVETVETSKGTGNFIIPVNYVNQAKAYFAGKAGDITEEQYNKIVGFLEDAKQKGIAVTKADPSVIVNGVVDIRKFPYEDKKFILTAGQEACKVVGLNLVFNGVNVVITEPDTGVIRFDDAPIIKTTGTDINVTAIALVFGVLAVLSASAVFVAKKADIF